MLNVLVACEESGVVREAFRALGHNAWSCDILPSRQPGQHYQGDVRDAHWPSWDLLIAHPPCTHLSVSGARHFAAKRADGRQQEAIDFFMMLANAPVAMKCIENPVCIMSSLYRKPDQIVQPWMFGHGETKATCLWLTGLPKLQPTNVVEGREARIHRMAPGPNRARERSATYQGIADGMAQQWTDHARAAVILAKGRDIEAGKTIFLQNDYAHMRLADFEGPHPVAPTPRGRPAGERWA